jgi:hypothetical protein
MGCEPHRPCIAGRPSKPLPPLARIVWPLIPTALPTQEEETTRMSGLAEPFERIEPGHALDLFRCLAFKEQLGVDHAV